MKSEKKREGLQSYDYDHRRDISTKITWFRIEFWKDHPCFLVGIDWRKGQKWENAEGLIMRAIINLLKGQNTKRLVTRPL